MSFIFYLIGMRAASERMTFIRKKVPRCRFWRLHSAVPSPGYVSELDPLAGIALLAVRRPSHFRNTAGVLFAHTIALLRILHQRTPPRRLYNFLRCTSCNIVLSRVSSASNCFNRVFSSRSCLTWRT